jgi:hypothetical protein
LPDPDTISSKQVRIVEIAVGVMLLGALCLSTYPLLPVHPWIRSFLVTIGVQFLLIPLLGLVLLGRRLGIWGDEYRSEREDERDIRKTKDSILGFTFFGLFALILFAISALSPFSWSKAGKITGIGFLYAGAFFASGALLGFLFGIPRSTGSDSKKKEKGPQSEEAAAGVDNWRSPYTANTNLEEISDWLTKIIVGLGLINLKTAPEYLKKAAWFFANFCGGDYCESVAVALMIYFSICGFFLGYLMTRLYITGAFTRADRAGLGGGALEGWYPGPPPGLILKDTAPPPKSAVAEATGKVDAGKFGPDSMTEVI